MATIKELLAENYKESMTLKEVEEILAKCNLADLNKGEYVSKLKYNADTKTLAEYRALAESNQAENEALKAQLKAYEKGGDKYIDPDELTRLKQFEADTKTAQKRTATENAVSEMLTRNKVLPGVIKLTLKGLNVDDVKLDANGKVTKEFEEAYMKAFKDDCPDGFVKPNEGTGAPAHGSGIGGGNGTPARKQTLSQILQEINS